MLIESMFTKNAFVGEALQGIAARNEVLMNNISNVDTPNFKKSTVDFEASLQDAIDKYKSTGELDLGSVTPTVRVQHANYTNRLDGNNVDIDVEMVELYKNAVKYDAIVGFAGYKNIQAVLTGVK